MRKYKAIVIVGMNSHEKTIEAKSIAEARAIANCYAHDLSNCGELYLSHVSVFPIKEKI